MKLSVACFAQRKKYLLISIVIISFISIMAGVAAGITTSIDTFDNSAGNNDVYHDGKAWDVDKDGKYDVIAFGYKHDGTSFKTTIGIYEWDGSKFNEEAYFVDEGEPGMYYSGDIFDIDGDRSPEIIVFKRIHPVNAGDPAGEIIIYDLSDDYQITMKDSVVTYRASDYMISHGALKVADLNNDGIPDIVTAGSARDNPSEKSWSYVQVFEYNGLEIKEKSWWSHKWNSNEDTKNGEVEIYDVDDDGKLEIIAQFGGRIPVSCDGDGGDIATDCTETAINKGVTAVFDYDSSGDLKLTDLHTDTYEGSMDGGQPGYFELSEAGNGLAVRDLDKNDGKLDVLFTGRTRHPCGGYYDSPIVMRSYYDGNSFSDGDETCVSNTKDAYGHFNQVEAFDFDNDGQEEIMAWGWLGLWAGTCDFGTYLFENDWTLIASENKNVNSFTNGWDMPQSFGVTLADYDGDKQLEYAIVGRAYSGGDWDSLVGLVDGFPDAACKDSETYLHDGIDEDCNGWVDDAEGSIIEVPIQIIEPDPGIIKDDILQVKVASSNHSDIKRVNFSLVNSTSGTEAWNDTLSIGSWQRFAYYYYSPNGWVTDITTSSVGEGDFILRAEATDKSGQISTSEIDITILFSQMTGKVVAYDKDNNIVPIKDAQGMAYSSSGTNHSFTTDSNGAYSVPRDLGETSLEIWLKDEDGVLVINSVTGFNRNVVSLKTDEMDLESKIIQKDIIFSDTYPDLDSSMTKEQKSVLRDAAVYYYNNYEALLFAEEELEIAYDHRLPVDVYIYSTKTDGAYYSISSSRIEVGKKGDMSKVSSTNSPDNREYHEFGHHVNADSTMGGSNTLPMAGKNHGGVDNSVSTDSIIEGFAEFFSLMVNNDSGYYWWGTVTDLERNYHLKGSGKPFEEFNVASLYWDILDDDNETGDYIALGVNGTWDILNSTNITTVRALYISLNNSIGDQDTNTTDGFTDLEALFVLHRFYSDANQSGTYDTGEVIGYADYYKSKVGSGGNPRHNQPRVPGTALDMDIVDDRSRDVEVNEFLVRVYFPESEYDFTYNTWQDSNGYLWVVVPPDSLRVEITPVVAGYEEDFLVLEPDKFWAAVDKAQEENKSVYMFHEFQVMPNDIDKPGRFKAAAVDSSSVKLTWKMPDDVGSVVLVKGLDHFPTSVKDGEVIYEGTEEQFIDSNLLAGIEVRYYYTIFSIVGDDTSQGATADVMAGGVEEEKRGIWVYLVVISAILLVAFALYRKRGMQINTEELMEWKDKGVRTFDEILRKARELKDKRK